MSFSFAVSNGDLVLNGSSLAIVTGSDKLCQDLQLWTAERYGSDRFHPTMGSTLQDAIGNVITPRTQYMMRTEVLRVLENYIKVQAFGFQARPTWYSLSELLDVITNVNVGLAYDTVSVSCSVRAAGGDPIPLNWIVGV